VLTHNSTGNSRPRRMCVLETTFTICTAHLQMNKCLSSTIVRYGFGCIPRSSLASLRCPGCSHACVLGEVSQLIYVDLIPPDTLPIYQFSMGIMGCYHSVGGYRWGDYDIICRGSTSNLPRYALPNYRLHYSLIPTSVKSVLLALDFFTCTVDIPGGSNSVIYR
jgi:hypothetical protein